MPDQTTRLFMVDYPSICRHDKLSAFIMNKTNHGSAIGKTVPVIDRNRCEGDAACVAVCPCHVFEMQSLTPADKATLSLRGKLKSWVHGDRQSYTVRVEACSACALCVDACPEQAIKLLNP